MLVISFRPTSPKQRLRSLLVSFRPQTSHLDRRSIYQPTKAMGHLTPHIHRKPQPNKTQCAMFEISRLNVPRIRRRNCKLALASLSMVSGIPRRKTGKRCPPRLLIKLERQLHRKEGVSHHLLRPYQQASSRLLLRRLKLRRVLLLIPDLKASCYTHCLS